MQSHLKKEYNLNLFISPCGKMYMIYYIETPRSPRDKHPRGQTGQKSVTCFQFAIVLELNGGYTFLPRRNLISISDTVEIVFCQYVGEVKIETL
jgi:hypothetical protein